MAKEHPLLMSGPMIRAYFDGRKTMTRRVVKPQFSKLWGYGVRNQDPEYFSAHVDIKEPNGEWRWLRCPHGKPGDSLWFRETWAIEARELYRGQTTYMIDYAADPGTPALTITTHPDAAKYVRESGKYRPSIFMPRFAARATPTIISIKVERLQDISEADILSEGVTVDRVAAWTNTPWSDMPTLHDAWRVWWNYLNAARGHSYEMNDWVWVIGWPKYTGSRD